MKFRLKNTKEKIIVFRYYNEIIQIKPNESVIVYTFDSNFNTLDLEVEKLSDEKVIRFGNDYLLINKNGKGTPKKLKSLIIKETSESKEQISKSELKNNEEKINSKIKEVKSETSEKQETEEKPKRGRKRKTN